MRAKAVRLVVTVCAVINVVFMLVATGFILFGESRLLSTFALAVNVFLFLEMRKTLRLAAAGCDSPAP